MPTLLTVPQPVKRYVYVDWNYAGLGNPTYTGDGNILKDISAYAQTIKIKIGNSGGDDYVVSVGTCTILLDNTDQRFSADYALGPLYGKLVPHKPIQVQAVDNLGTAVGLFTGFIKTITPTTSIHGKRICIIQAHDWMGELIDADVQIPIQINRTADQLMAIVLDAAAKSTPRYWTETFTGNPANNDFVTINGQKYTFKTVIVAAFDVLIGATAQDTADNLAASVNGAPGIGTTYGNSTVRSTIVSATRQQAISTFPSQSTWKYLAGTSGITITTPAGATGGFAYQQAGGLQNQSMSYDFFIDVGGSYTFGVLGVTQNDAGIATWYVDGVAVVSGQDWYSAAQTLNVAKNNTISLTPGAHTLSYIMATKNASSSAYNLRTQTISLTPVNPLLRIAANIGGSMSDLLTLSVSSANISSVQTASAKIGNLSYGGSLMTGKNVFTYAGDTWQAGVNALSALQEIAQSDYGWIMCTRGSDVRFYSRDFFFGAINATPIFTLVDQPNLTLLTDETDIVNRIQVQYTPRSALASGVIAKSTTMVTAAGHSGTERWNGTDRYPLGGNTVVKLPAIDPTTGQPMAILSIITPLVAGTDYDSASDPGGLNDYTTYTPNPLSFSVVPNATDLEISIKNFALGPLYLGATTGIKLQVRGVGLVKYNPSFAVAEDTASQLQYSLNIKKLTIPLPVTQVYAEALASYYIVRYKDPHTKINKIDFGDQRIINNLHLLNIKLTDTLQISDTQSGISNARFVVVGFEYDFDRGGVMRLSCIVRRLDAPSYWILGDATYGILGSTTRLAL